MADASRATRLIKLVLVWVLTIPGSAIMLLAGGGKLGSDVWAGIFDDWGFPGWFRILVSLAQVVGGLTLLMPRIAAYGAGLLVVVMSGALATELLMEPEFGRLMPSVLAAVYALLFVARWKLAVGPLARVRHTGTKANASGRADGKA